MERFTLLSMPFGTTVTLKESIKGERDGEKVEFEAGTNLILEAMNLKQNKVMFRSKRNGHIYTFKFKKFLTVA